MTSATPSNSAGSSGAVALSARIVSPTLNQTVNGLTLTVLWETIGYNIVPAAQARRPDEVTSTSSWTATRPDPRERQPDPARAIRTSSTPPTRSSFQNVANGPHQAWLVLAHGDHVPLQPRSWTR